MRARTLAVTVLAGAAAVVGVGGVLHLPFARGVLMKAGGCPVGNASLAAMEPARRELIRANRGADPAPARPALGFNLDVTRRDEVLAWASGAGVACHEEREGLTFCDNVPARALGIPEADGPVSEVHFGFGPRGVLVDVATMRNNATARPAIDIRARLAKEVGAPKEEHGGFDEETLARPVSTVTYRYNDYMAELIAMRLPSQGLVVREHYMSARD